MAGRGPRPSLTKTIKPHYIDTMNGFPLDHIGIAVASIAEARTIYEPLTGDACSNIEAVPSQGVNVAFLGKVELIEPATPQSTIARFISKRGEGLHHIAYRVEDLQAELRRLAAEGVDLIDSEPRPGARGHQVAFLHPRSTGGVLIELVQP
jgi:methylmalonyl-CoA/ethylmalonyl-CoA epimerase